MAKIPEIKARSIDRVFDSKAKVNQYDLEHKDEELVNISEFELNIEEWEVEWNEQTHHAKMIVKPHMWNEYGSLYLRSKQTVSLALKIFIHVVY